MRGTRKGSRGASQRNARQTDDQAAKRTRLGGGIKPLSGGGGIFKSAAVAVLKIERKLMTTGEITKVALERGLIKCQGKTPEATMASALYTDVKRKHDKSVFTRPQEGLFGLREWIGEGFFPEGWVGPIDGLGVAPFKKRNSVPAKTHRSSSSRSTKPRTTQSWKEASSDFEEDPGECDTADEEEVNDDEETEDLVEEEEQEEESPRPRSVTKARGRGRDASSGGGAAAATASGAGGAGGGGGGGSRTTTTRSQEVPSASAAVNQQSEDVQGAAQQQQQQQQQQQAAMESPLHVLGDAAEMSQEPEPETTPEPAPAPAPAKAAAESGMGGKRKRRPSSLQVPEGGGISGGSGEEVLMPKSPLDDSLAALHEIATSPSTYAASSGAEGASKRKRRASLGLGDLGSGLFSGHMGRQNSLTSPASLLHALDSGSLPMLADHGAMLLSGPDTGKLPLISLSIPSLASPHLLDSAGLLQHHLPDSLPATPDMLALAMNSAGLGSLISPQALALGWGSRAADGAARDAGLLGRRYSEDALGMLLQMSHAGLPLGHSSQAGRRNPPPFAGSAAVSAFAAGPSQSPPPPPQPREYGVMTPQQVQGELTEIGRMRVVVERLEGRMGRSNPQVAKAWLSLARMYQHVGGAGPEARAPAAEALARAAAACRRFAAEHGLSVSGACDDSFGYLTSKVAAPDAGAGRAQPPQQHVANGDGPSSHERRAQQQQQQPAVLQSEPTLSMPARAPRELGHQGGTGGGALSGAAADAAPTVLQTAA